MKSCIYCKCENKSDEGCPAADIIYIMVGKIQKIFPDIIFGDMCCKFWETLGENCKHWETKNERKR